MRHFLPWVLLAGCSHPVPPPEPAHRTLPTTDAQIALGNLEGDLATGEQLLGRSPENVGVIASLVPLYLMHAQLLGHLSEYDHAEALAERAVQLAPNDKRAWMARAEVHSRFHQFDDALADLARAEKLGATDLETRRASIYQATGRYAEARPIREKWARGYPRLETLGALATLDTDEGRLDDAEREFGQALARFREVSPFPLVWLWLQEGTMLQNAGKLSRARELLSAAHERLPFDVGTISHLAAALAGVGGGAIGGDREKAIALLRAAVAGSDDPEYAGQLGELLRASGQLREADELRARASFRYQELLQKHPAAFADHAARFFLAAGDARRALGLAEQNLRVRRTAESEALVVETATAAGEGARACAVVEDGLATFPRSARLHILGWSAFKRCGKSDRAAEELQALEKLAAAI